MSNEFFPADVGRDIAGAGGLGTITGYTDPETVTVEIKQPFPANSFESGTWAILGTPQTSCTPSAKDPVGTVITLTLAAGGWRTADVGKYVRINGGLCRITAYTSSTVVSARIETELTATVAAPSLAWTLESTMWGGVYGYPRCGTYFEQRLWLAGSPGFPQGIWSSVIGEPLDLTTGTLDDEGLNYLIGSGEVNAVLHLVSARGLVALTTGGEFSIRGGQERAITPTNLQVRDQSNYGASQVKPARVGQEIYFVQRDNRKIRSLSPNQYDDGQYVAPDMSVLAEHITESGVIDMAYQPEPDTLLYVVRDDGQIATFSADRDQEVYAWARQKTQGKFESVEVVPTAAGNSVFVIVQRTVNGSTTRYVEMFDSSLHTDSAITGTSGPGATVWGGLNHLKGMIVFAKGDGVFLGNYTVNGSGQITLSRSSKTVEIGLAYTTTVLTLTPEAAGIVNSTLGQQLNAYKTKVKLLSTYGCLINLQQVAFSPYGSALPTSTPATFTGDKDAGNLGWASGKAQTLVQQVLPYPFHLLSVISSMSINEG